MRINDPKKINDVYNKLGYYPTRYEFIGGNKTACPLTIMTLAKRKENGEENYECGNDDIHEWDISKELDLTIDYIDGFIAAVDCEYILCPNADRELGYKDGLVIRKEIFGD